MIAILHNNRCGKSRDAVKLLTEKGLDFEIIPYLEGVLTSSDLEELLRKLKLSPLEIIRKNEAIFKENFKSQDNNEAEWLKILVENPKLIERPILYTKNKAVVGRPIENVINFLKNL